MTSINVNYSEDVHSRLFGSLNKVVSRFLEELDRVRQPGRESLYFSGRVNEVHINVDYAVNAPSNIIITMTGSRLNPVIAIQLLTSAIVYIQTWMNMKFVSASFDDTNIVLVANHIENKVAESK